jgi:Xaa-Pro aminopeptidase
MTSLYASRRAALATQLGAGGIALIPTSPERARNRDADFPFRHDSYFYYLTGFTEPKAWLLIEASGHSTVFCQPKDK